jgi:hypothetical protein
MRKLPDGVPKTGIKNQNAREKNYETQPLKEKNKMKHASFKTIFQPWILVTLIVLLQTGTLFAAGTEVAA